MYELKKLHKDAIPGALAKAERYRLLNEAREAESIARDILATDSANEDARVLLILALSDQFPHRLSEAWNEAIGLVDGLGARYAAAYYRGILYERRAKTALKSGRHGALRVVASDLRRAMDLFEQAAASAPAGDDAALLRWNTCARVLNADPSLEQVEESAEPSMLE